MSTDMYIAVAWIVTLLVLAAYAAWILRRGRALSDQVPEERRRWM